MVSTHRTISSLILLGIVYRCIATHLCKKAGFSRKVAQTGAVTLIQRFGRSGAPGALNLNIHFHVFARSGLAPNSKHRAVVTKAKRGNSKQADLVDEPSTPTERRASMTWAQRLKRVFNFNPNAARSRLARNAADQ